MKRDLIRSFMQIEGNLNLDVTRKEKDGSIRISGGRLYGPQGEDSYISIVMDKYQLEAIEACEGVHEIYECYKEMGYF